MNYEFPKILTINDVLPHIDNNFIVVDRGDHKIINYVMMGNETFPEVDSVGAAVRRECRGIIFDQKGHIIRRPLHKFFNCNEREETNVSKLDWESKHDVLDKLDGSQIAPYKLDSGEVIWGTKMGKTDVGLQAQNYVAENKRYTNFANLCFSACITPIFEWVSNKQRIILNYPQDDLILIAMRYMVSGEYIDQETVERWADHWKIPVVKVWNASLGGGNHQTFIDDLSKREGIEGVVIRFQDGHMIKVKCEWYVRLHKTKDQISSEKNIVELLINNQIDDIIPFLLEDDKKKLDAYTVDFHTAVDNYVRILQAVSDGIVRHNMSRKEYALDSKSSAFFKGIIFKRWDNPSLEIKPYLLELIKKHCTSNQQFAKIKESILKGIKYEF